MTTMMWRKTINITASSTAYSRVALRRYIKSNAQGSLHCKRRNSEKLPSLRYFATEKENEKIIPVVDLQSSPPPIQKLDEIDIDNSSSTISTSSETSTLSSSSSSSSTSPSKNYGKTIAELSKARLSALVVSTTSFGYLAAAPVPIDYMTLACVSIGTGLCSSSASTWNQIFEYDRDSKMKRTSRRPLVTQDVVGVKGATILATCTGISGGSILYLGTDVITAALGVGNITLYAGAYTYLKPRSEWNTWVGAIVGAIPPVMGYTAATNGLGLLDLESAMVGSALLLWQFPHFFALSWMHRVDYARSVFYNEN